MIQTTFSPQTNSVKNNILENYIGKKVHAIFYIDEEVAPNIFEATQAISVGNTENIDIHASMTIEKKIP